MSSIPETDPYWAIMKLHAADHLIYLRANQLLKPYGITIQQALIIHYLFQYPDQKVNQKHLELFLGISNPSVTSLMKSMVGKNLIRRLPDRSDARSYLLYLTEHGQQMQLCIGQALHQLSEETNTGLSSEDVRQLTNLLDKMTKNLTTVTRQ